MNLNRLSLYFNCVDYDLKNIRKRTGVDVYKVSRGKDNYLL